MKEEIQAEGHVPGAQERGCEHLWNSQGLVEMRGWSLKLGLAQEAGEPR